MQQVQPHREIAQLILKGHSLKKAIIVGPCSVHSEDELLEYAHKLKPLADSFKDHLFIVLRTFIEKPRTAHDWKGFLSDPKLDGSQDLKEGIRRSLKLFERLSSLNIPLAMEFIDPNLAPLFAPFITWGFVGARTSRSPVHRQLASHLGIPMGFKNAIDGDIETCFQAMAVAQESHTGYFTNRNLELEYLKTQGNPLTHPVLRGSIQGSNYKEALNHHIPLMIDCSHGNSGKNIEKMESIFLESFKWSLEAPHIFGFMLESYLESGSQKIGPTLKKNLSVTDPCLGFEETKALLETAYKLVSQSRTSSPSISIGSSFISPSSSEIWMSGV